MRLIAEKIENAKFVVKENKTTKKERSLLRRDLFTSRSN